MQRLEKITTVKNEIEAICLRSELEQRGIPHLVQSHHDSALDGLYQYHGVWGHVEAPANHRDEVLQILEDLRTRSASPDENSDVINDE